MATHTSVLARRIPWKEEPREPQSTGSQRVEHDWVTNTFTCFIQVCLYNKLRMQASSSPSPSSSCQMKRNPDSSSSKQLSDHEGMHSEQWNFLQELGMMVTSHQLSTLDFSYFRKIYFYLKNLWYFRLFSYIKPNLILIHSVIWTNKKLSNN